MRRRYRVLEIPDDTARAVAAKLLERPDLLAGLTELCAGRGFAHRAVERHGRRGRACRSPRDRGQRDRSRPVAPRLQELRSGPGSTGPSPRRPRDGADSPPRGAQSVARVLTGRR
jgi:hypothetical protein